MRPLLLILWLLVSVPAFAGETADLVMKAGADYRASLTWTDATGTAINITGNSYAAQFRSAVYPAGTLFATYSTTITNAAAGQMRISLSRAQTAALSGKAGVWDLKQTTSGGEVKYRFGGTARVLPVVTAP
jgi:hypothetical protein